MAVESNSDVKLLLPKLWEKYMELMAESYPISAARGELDTFNFEAELFMIAYELVIENNEES